MRVDKRTSRVPDSELVVLAVHRDHFHLNIHANCRVHTFIESTVDETLDQRCFSDSTVSDLEVEEADDVYKG